MRTFTRNISFSESTNLLNFCTIGEIKAEEKATLVKIKKKLDEAFEKEAEDFTARKEEAVKKGLHSIPWIDSEKEKKPIELRHDEISVIANCLLKTLNSERTTWVGTEEIQKLCDENTLMLHKWLDKNIRYDKIDLIEVEEDADLIPEE